VETLPESAPIKLVDSGLRCPSCEYNLNGVAENRCPECGGDFDPDYLRSLLAGAPAPIPIWDDDSQYVVLRFVKICLMTWFLPTRVGKKFPRRYSRSSALRFRLIVVAVAIAAYSASFVLMLGPPAVVRLCFAAVPVLTGIVLFETMLGAALQLLLCADEWPAVVNPAASESWDGLVGFFRSFVLLQALVVGGAVLLASFGAEDVWLAAAWAVAVCLPFWWWASLSAAILVQRAGTGWKIAAVCLIPILVGLAAILAGFVGVVVAIVADSIW
jgi:hypothetical protein